MKNREGAQFLGPEELNLLQECFDAILERRGLARGSEDADAIARTLLDSYARGVSDKQELIGLADINAAA